MEDKVPVFTMLCHLALFAFIRKAQVPACSFLSHNVFKYHYVWNILLGMRLAQSRDILLPD